MNDATLSLTLSGVIVSKDILLLILPQLEKMFRTSKPKEWGTFRLVCKIFNELISQDHFDVIYP